jgi:hypothetical protein
VDIVSTPIQKLAQPLHQSGGPLTLRRRRARAKVSDGPRLPRLLRARRERPRSRAADHTDKRASLYGRPVRPGLRPIRLSIQTIKTGKDVGRNGKAVRQMCTAEILGHPMLRMGQERRIGAVATFPLCPHQQDVGADIVEPPVSATSRYKPSYSITSSCGYDSQSSAANEKAGVVSLEPGDIRDGGEGVRLKKPERRR